MRIRTILTMFVAAAAMLAFVAAPADAAHSKAKKYRGLELTREAAQAADDGFGVAPEGTSGEGTLYLNHGKDRACVIMSFTGEIVALHIHEKDADSANPQTGPVVVDFGAGLSYDAETDTTAADICVVDDANQRTIRDILTGPDEYYINAHTPDLSVVRTELGRN